MKDDLIRRGDALEALNKQQPIDKSVMRRVVVQVPAVDAVEVVRCKDCKWRNTAGCPYMNFDAADREDSDFCSDGERREDDDI